MKAHPLPVPADIVRLSKTTFRSRKLLWIFGVPFFFVGLFTLEGNLLKGGAMLVLGIVCCVIASTRRPPLKQTAIRLMMEEGESIDRLLVKDIGGYTQIVLAGGGVMRGLLEIEDKKKTGEALDVLCVHLPHAQVDWEPNDWTYYAPADFRFWERF